MPQRKSKEGGGEEKRDEEVNGKQKLVTQEWRRGVRALVFCA